MNISSRDKCKSIRYVVTLPEDVLVKNSNLFTMTSPDGHAVINAFCISTLFWKRNNQVKKEISKLACLRASPRVKMIA